MTDQGLWKSLGKGEEGFILKRKKGVIPQQHSENQKISIDPPAEKISIIRKGRKYDALPRGKKMWRMMH